MRIFEIYLDSAWHDISDLYVPSSLTIQRSGINSERKSSVTSCSFTLYFNERLYNAIISCEDEIPVRISDGEHNIIFDGQMDPVISTSWKTPEEADSFSIAIKSIKASIRKALQKQEAPRSSCWKV